MNTRFREVLLFFTLTLIIPSLYFANTRAKEIFGKFSRMVVKRDQLV